MPQETAEPNAEESGAAEATEPKGRRELIWAVLKFQVKLAADGLIDLLLGVGATAALIVGLVEGGPKAHRPFRQLLHWGRRSERWLNLFGRFPTNGSSDAWLEPVRERAFESLDGNATMRRAEDRVNAELDAIRGRLNSTRPTKGTPQSDAEATAADADSATPRTPPAQEPQ